jgi:hypothetical protein
VAVVVVVEVVVVALEEAALAVQRGEVAPVALVALKGEAALAALKEEVALVVPNLDLLLHILHMEHPLHILPVFQGLLMEKMLILDLQIPEVLHPLQMRLAHQGAQYQIHLIFHIHITIHLLIIQVLIITVIATAPTPITEACL